MRREDRAMDEAFALKVIDRAFYGVLSLVEADATPYAVPLSFIRKGHMLYFHSAKAGHKVDLMADGTVCHVSFVAHAEVPDLFSEATMQEMAQTEQGLDRLTRSLFTLTYESALVKGKMVRVKDEATFHWVLKALCGKYAPCKAAPYVASAIETGGPRTAIYAIEIEEISGKRKAYDDDGVELKWQRQKAD